MTESTCISFLLLLAIQGSLQKSAPSSPTYRAAVVELNPVHYKFDAERTMNENGATTVSYIEQAAEKNVDIVVFPELGLSTFEHSSRNNLIPYSSKIPPPSQRYAACDSNDTSVRQAVRMVACAAKRNKDHTFMFLPKPVQGLIIFGVWGRNYDEDVINPGTRIFSILLGVTILVILFGKLWVYFL